MCSSFRKSKICRTTHTAPPTSSSITTNFTPRPPKCYGPIRMPLVSSSSPTAIWMKFESRSFKQSDVATSSSIGPGLMTHGIQRSKRYTTKRNSSERGDFQSFRALNLNSAKGGSNSKKLFRIEMACRRTGCNSAYDFSASCAANSR